MNRPGPTTIPQPDLDDLSWRSLSRRSLAASAVLSLAIVAPAVVVLAKLLYGLHWPLAAIAAACAGAAVLIVAAALAYDEMRLRTTRWRLTDDRVELRSGIAVRQHLSIPRDRVRSVDLRADPVRRVFGLTVVKVGTGEHATDRTELTLDPLTGHEAERLRHILLRTAAQEEPEGPLAELRWSWIRYAPLTVWSFAGGALVLGGLYKLVDAFGVNLFSTGTASGAWEWVTGRPWLTVPLLFLANVVIGLLGAVLLFAEAWGRYRLEREPGRLRLRRGLLTTRSLTLEERRLRGVELSEPLLLRLGGGARVKAVATGLGKAEENETEDVAALTPPLPRDLAERLAARLAGASDGRLLPPPEAGPFGGGLVPHPRAARRRRVVRALVTVASLAAAAGVASVWLPLWASPWTWAAPVVALPVALWLAAGSYRSLGHALAERHLITRRGAVRRRTVALDRAGIVGWTITQSFFQRRAGLLTVSATTAAGDGHYDVVDVGRADGLDLAAEAVPDLLGPFLRKQ
ncbi:PH domain-containing protein [Nonomuraea sp. NPDC000554]|uniref:PH domain-containing protein n=1 Tax=Nonomuraea sp. NPDC000554 TaxID=3154259 RepID=UPI00331E4488